MSSYEYDICKKCNTIYKRHYYKKNIEYLHATIGHILIFSAIIFTVIRLT